MLVFGSAVVDLTAHVRGPINANEAPMVMGLAGSPHVAAGGGGLGVAVDCARLGVPTHLVALIGDDNFGDLIAKRVAHIAQSCLLEPTFVMRAGSSETLARTGVDMRVLSDLVSPQLQDGASLHIPCPGTSALVGDREVAVAGALLAVDRHPSSRIGMVMLALDSPIAATRQVANLAKEARAPPQQATPPENAPP
jgi:hypothetical protein